MKRNSPSSKSTNVHGRVYAGSQPPKNQKRKRKVWQPQSKWDISHKKQIQQASALVNHHHRRPRPRPHPRPEFLQTEFAAGLQGRRANQEALASPTKVIIKINRAQGGECCGVFEVRQPWNVLPTKIDVASRRLTAPKKGLSLARK